MEISVGYLFQVVGKLYIENLQLRNELEAVNNTVGELLEQIEQLQQTEQEELEDGASYSYMDEH